MLYGNSDMKKIYLNPLIVTAGLECIILAASGPGAGDIFSPTVSDDAKGHSVWDEVNDTYNINKEEQEDENWN